MAAQLYLNSSFIFVPICPVRIEMRCMYGSPVTLVVLLLVVGRITSSFNGTLMIERDEIIVEFLVQK